MNTKGKQQSENVSLNEMLFVRILETIATNKRTSSLIRGCTQFNELFTLKDLDNQLEKM